MTADLTAAAAGRRSPFAGADVCRQAGFRLPAGTSPPRFEDDVWDLAEVIGLPVQLHLSTCHLRLGELTRWLNWLTGRGVTDLSQVSDAHCGAYLDHRRHARDDT